MNRQAIKHKYRWRTLYGGLLLLLLLGWQAGQAAERGLLWRISGPDGNASYLLGTLHSDDARVMALAQESIGYLQDSQLLLLEIVPDLTASERTMEYLLFTDQRRLSGLVDRNLYDRARLLLLKHGIPEPMVDKMKPWAVYVTLSMPVQETGMFLDLQLYRLARASKIDVGGLETIDEQLGIFDGMSMPEQIRMMRDVIDEYPNLSEEFDRLRRTYLSRDLDRLLDIANEQIRRDDPTEQRLEQQLIHDRNRRMAERLLPYLESGGVFIAVGALHLPGPTGLLQLLREQNYQVTAVF